MKVKQISVFMENKAGRLAQIMRVLGDVGINILTLALADTADFGILRLLVSDNGKAVTVLKAAGFTVGENDVLAVDIPDRPGGLADFLELIGVNDINIEYMYAYRKGDKSILIFRFEDLDRAEKIFADTPFRLLSSEELYGL